MFLNNVLLALFPQKLNTVILFFHTQYWPCSSY